MKSDIQTTLPKRGEFTLPVTSTQAATATKEEPRASTFLESMQNLLKPRKTKKIVDATPDSSISGAHALPTVDQPKAQGKSSFWQRILEKRRMRADAKKRYRHEICERYFRAIRTYLSDKPTRFHLVDEDFAIDNTVVDNGLKDLKRKIIEVASKQPYWAEQIPARWIPLEEELIRLRAAGVKVISLIVLKDLNQAGRIPISIDELDLFLRFQHDIGTILYFSMDILKDKIVLDPQWMIDALKSLITAEMFVLRSNPTVTEKWFEFQKKGKLSQELIDAVWTKKKHPDLHDNKEHILLLMEQLNIIAKLRVYSEEASEIKEENCFLAPCMLQQKTPREVIYPVPHPQMGSSSVICYVFMGKYLPSPIFHRLLAACIAHWPIATKKNEKILENLIFCGCCVFQLDHYHKLTIHFRDYIIYMRVTRMGITDKIPSSKLCMEVREFVSATLIKIIGCLGQSLKFEYFIQCPEYSGDSINSLIPVSLLKENADVCCELHNNMIESYRLLQFFFEDMGSQGQKRRDTGHHKTPDVLVTAERKELVIEMGSTQTEQEFGKEDHLLQQQEMETKELSGSETDQEDEAQDNADAPITQEHINHARLCNAMTTVCADALREILVNQVPIPYANIYQAILDKQDYLTSRRLLNNDQIDVVFPDLLERFTGTVDQFDISLLYTIIRSVSSVPVPATGWGNPPADQPRDATLGASVERIRFFRNKISAHSVDGKISETEFIDYWQNIEAVLRDIETIIGDHGYQGELDKRKNQVITPQEAREQRKKIRAHIKAVKEKIVSDLDALAEAANA